MQALLQLYRQWCGCAPANTERLPGAASNRQYVRFYAPEGCEPRTVVGVIGQSFDENACCHLALGRGFTNLYPDFERYSSEEIHRFGINKSLSHVDFMIGTPDLKIVGTDQDGEEVVLFENGVFAI